MNKRKIKKDFLWAYVESQGQKRAFVNVFPEHKKKKPLGGQFVPIL